MLSIFKSEKTFDYFDVYESQNKTHACSISKCFDFSYLLVPIVGTYSLLGIYYIIHSSIYNIILMYNVFYKCLNHQYFPNLHNASVILTSK